MMEEREKAREKDEAEKLKIEEEERILVSSCILYKHAHQNYLTSRKPAIFEIG